MKHLGLILVASLALGGCHDDSEPGPPNGGYLTCDQLTTCGSCTELLGCGWCTIGNGGACVSEPNACWRAKTFEWTWEPSGCPGSGASASDASVLDASVSDASASDAAD